MAEHPIEVSWDKYLGWHWRCFNCNLGRYSFDDRDGAELQARAHQHQHDGSDDEQGEP